ncbi:amino acid adenylation domain-containing protein [Legionella sp. km535]|uniref:amino acid adenylation domain-containing protein n=1 Tax=Legionella sp. km535 TaxID=2498107 RepID=UPI000F8EFAB8|nr:amino acid adenylation domain-containing protein [Legionella sp. km535]RUR19989.1 amino acid adenylation domain-containing protein [Legionella sp. km535]
MENKTCILIGDDTLLVECATILVQRQYTIKTVISSFEVIQLWCKKNKIPCISLAQYDLSETQPRVDYLFSIVNGHLLNARHLRCVRQFAFNYHDSLLPAYAGLNATTWSILNNEPMHGITWHLMNERIDAGDIVYQKSFSSENNTALSLNLRCFEEAVIGFNILLDNLESNQLKFWKQSAAGRSYYGKDKVIPQLGFIDWNTSAEFIVRMFRALAHGHYPNHVGTLKLLTQTTSLIISSMEQTNTHSTQAKPGEIIAADEQGIELATSCGTLLIKECRASSGKVITPLECAQEYGMQIGSQLACFQLHEFNELSHYYIQSLNQEAYWINEFRQVVEHSLFSERAYVKKQEMNPFGCISFKGIDDELLSVTFIATVLVYLYRLNDYEHCSCFLLKSPEPVGAYAGRYLFGDKLPLSVDLQADNTFNDTLAFVKNKVESLTQRAPYLIDLLVRYPSLEEVFIEPVITLRISQDNTQTIPECSVMHFELNEQTSELKLFHKLDLDYQQGGLQSLIHHAPEHLSQILHLILEAPKLRINEFELITPMERRHIYLWGLGEKHQLPSQSIYSMFHEQVMKRPNAAALYSEQQVITYHTLWNWAESVASFIRLLNIPPQTPMGIYMERSKEMLPVILGILRVGCIYVPLDRKYPFKKIELILKEAKINCIFSNEESAKILNDHFQDDDSVRIYLTSDLLSNKPCENASPIEVIPLEKNDIAYYMFTSGTTGIPKGVMISHLNVINYCHWFTQTTDFNQDSIIDFSSSIAFDLSIPCTLAPLMYGGALAVCSDYQKMSPELYLKHLQKHKITHTELTPGYLDLLLQHPDEIKTLHHLKYLMLGADTVHIEEVKKWMSLCPDCHVVNEYGPTETTVSVTSFRVPSNKALTGTVVPIGQPAFNSSCYIVDKFMNLCPIGMKGELCIGGNQVSLGYLNKLDLTCKKFIEVFFNGKDRVYKTGDLVSWLPDGVVQFFGRNDHQVKLHGYRIELAAIESILMKHEHISQAVVVICNENTNNKTLRAYLVSEDKLLTVKQLKHFLLEYLPSYMHPKEYYLVDFIPLKENEKINFDVLEKQSGRVVSYDLIQNDTLMTEMERLCLECWKESFQMKDIQLDDDFFSIGGDSLTALHIIGQLKRLISIDIHLSLLFQFPTVRSLASYLDDRLNEQEHSEISHLITQDNSPLIKLSCGAHKIPLFLVHPIGGSVFWYQQLAHELKGDLTVYGIEDPSLNDSDIKFSSLEEIATYYVECIAHKYSGKRIYLGGASFGANLAFAMAHHMKTRGMDIQFLGIFDGWLHYPSTLMQHNTLDLLTHKFSDLPSEEFLRLTALEEYRRNLLLSYKPSVIDSDVILFKARELWPQFATVDSFDNGWKKIISGQLEVHLVPGSHETMFFAPHVKYLAELVKKIIYET